jgi:hypothetical protein
MTNRYLATSHALARRVCIYALSTTTRRWTTFGALAAAFLALYLVPPLGVAVLGTAFAGWWLVVFLAVLFGAVAGNAIGASRALKKERSGNDVRP